MQQPSIYLGSFEIAEPITTLTDILISGVCVYAYITLNQIQSRSRDIQYLRMFFVSMGVATFYGGVVGHALLPHLGFGWKVPGWIISMISVTFLERFSIECTKGLIPPQRQSLFLWINMLELLIFLFLVLSQMRFFWVQVHAGYGILLITGGFLTYVYAQTRQPYLLWFFAGIFWCMVSAIIFASHKGLGVWFNHIDISHVSMALGAYCFFLGGKNKAIWRSI